MQHGPSANDWDNTPFWVRIQYRHYIRNANSMFHYNPTVTDEQPGCKRCHDETATLTSGFCGICLSMIKKGLPKRKRNHGTV